MIENYSYLYAWQKLILFKNKLHLHSYLSTLRLHFPHQSGDFNHTVVCLDDINFNSFFYQTKATLQLFYKDSPQQQKCQTLLFVLGR